jgi:hypothetical protein
MPVLFADDTMLVSSAKRTGINIIITNSSPTHYENDITQIFKNINDWFRANLLTLDFDKNILYNF